MESDAPADDEEDPNDPGYAPSFAGSDLPSPADVEADLDPNLLRTLLVPLARRSPNTHWMISFW